MPLAKDKFYTSNKYLPPITHAVHIANSYVIRDFKGNVPFKPLFLYFIVSLFMDMYCAFELVLA